jgi:hypothetical protein
MPAGKKFTVFHHIDSKSIEEMYNEYSPVFVLSTGRCGSKFICNLLGLSPEVAAHHEPEPILQYFSNYAYHHQNDGEILTGMIHAARMELVLRDYNENKIYVESNQCLTFFAYALSNLYPRSKFVHLIRHPGDFVASAVKKGWHLNDSIWEAGRVRMAGHDAWTRLTHIEKLSWTWHTTNEYITRFGTDLEQGRFAAYRIEDILSDEQPARSLMAFTGIKNEVMSESINTLRNKKINELEIHANEPPNMKKQAVFPVYREWPQEMKDGLAVYTKELPRTFGYEL